MQGFTPVIGYRQRMTSVQTPVSDKLHTMRISGREARRNQDQPIASWATARRRLRSGIVIPATFPSFSLSNTDTILTMGSCFARNIENHLARMGCRIPALEFAAEENMGPFNEMLNLFAPPAFLNEIEWTKVIYRRDRRVTFDDCRDVAFKMPSGLYIDLGLVRGKEVTEQKIVERRQKLFNLYASAFSAHCLIMTPGLVESWYDQKTGKHINAAPIRDKHALDIDRFSLDVLTFEQCRDALARTIEIIRAENQTIKILITVSPVPLRFTFTCEDILTANTYSKSVLRAACNCLVSAADRIDYFPSYEAVTLSSRGVWESDKRHVKPAFVGKIVEQMTKRYFDKEAFSLPDSAKLNLTQRISRFLNQYFDQQPSL
jgi:hypothetical protein